MTNRFKCDVYNLEFPPWVTEIRIGKYRFTRGAKYGSRVVRLQHFGNVHAEFTTAPNAGENVATAVVEGEASEPSVFFADDRSKSALDDALLLLSLFTRRDVFSVASNETPLLADPRMFGGGAILQCSIAYRSDEPKGHVNVGFGEGLDAIFEKTREFAWQKKYDYGHFLVLARHAFKLQPLESCFTQCWTIWEHLFATLNSDWMSADTIRNLHAHEKIAFILREFALRPVVGDRVREKIRSLASIRNRLVHYGRFPVGSVRDDAVLFCLITEFVVAKILDLHPSNVFNTFENLSAFLDDSQKSAARPKKRGANATPPDAPSHRKR